MKTTLNRVSIQISVSKRDPEQGYLGKLVQKKDIIALYKVLQLLTNYILSRVMYARTYVFMYLNHTYIKYLCFLKNKHRLRCTQAYIFNVQFVSFFKICGMS